MAEFVPMEDLQPKEVLDGFHVAAIGRNDFMYVQHFRAEPGSTFPEHKHPHQQIVFVYSGNLTIQLEGEEYVVGPGDTYIVRSEELHSGGNESDENVLGVDVFSPPIEPDWIY